MLDTFQTADLLRVPRKSQRRFACTAQVTRITKIGISFECGCAQVSLGYKPGGKPHRKLLYGKTRTEVSEALKRTLRDQQLGLTITSERQTVKQFLTDWLENSVKPQEQATHL
jgi:hypothetical protein